MTELLRRSKLAPLHLHIDVDPTDSTNVSQWLRGPQTLRVESLVIDGANPSESESLRLLQPLLVYEFPALKYLKLAQHSTERNFALPQNILSHGRQPTLTSIIFTSWMPRWPLSISFRHLRRLHLCMPAQELPMTPSGADFLVPTTQQLVDMLSDMQSLCDIHLDDVFPIQGSFPSPIRLPGSLERIYLSSTRTATSNVCAQLWSALIIPSSASVIIEFTCASPDGIKTIHEAIAKPDSGLQMSAVEIVFGQASINLKGSRTDLQPCLASPETILHEKHQLNKWNSGHDSLLRLDPDENDITDFVQHLQLGLVRVLHFTLRILRERPDTQLWVDSLSPARSVERVVLSVAPASTTLLYAMTQTLDSRPPETKTFALFPCLYTLTLHGHSSGTKAAEIPTFVDVLIYLIHVRKEFGHPLRVIHVSASLKDSSAWDSVAIEVPITWFG